MYIYVCKYIHTGYLKKFWDTRGIKVEQIKWNKEVIFRKLHDFFIPFYLLYLYNSGVLKFFKHPVYIIITYSFI